PILRTPENAAYIHGETGLGGSDLIPDADESIMDFNVGGVQAMADAIINSSEPVVLAAVGPLTNIALLLLTYPQAKKNIKEILIMGGGFGLGNVTPVAEFNIYADPEACQVVLNSGVERIVMVPLNCTHQSSYTREHQEKFTELITPINPNFARMINELTDYVRQKYVSWGLDPNSISWHDPIAVSHCIVPEAFEDVEMNVTTVFGHGVQGEGQTIGDPIMRHGKKPNCVVVMKMKDEAFFKEMFTAWEIAAKSSIL
ncbi:hypothetical protein BB560_006725, partial [Smittium megazygosporum]